jgi:hypothetical protein
MNTKEADPTPYCLPAYSGIILEGISCRRRRRMWCSWVAFIREVLAGSGQRGSGAAEGEESVEEDMDVPF